MRNTMLLPLWLVTLTLLGCQADPPPDDLATVEPTQCGDIQNMHRIGDLYVSGAVTPEDLPLLKDLGIKTILNLRHANETDFDEAKLAKAQGITHIHLPWNGPKELTDAKLDAMRRVLREAERPLLFHCGSANRAGAGWLAYRVLDQGVELDTATQEAKTFGLRTQAYETITVDYIKRSR